LLGLVGIRNVPSIFQLSATIALTISFSELRREQLTKALHIGVDLGGPKKRACPEIGNGMRRSMMVGALFSALDKGTRSG
jgi:hypothetical protein